MKDVSRRVAEKILVTSSIFIFKDGYFGTFYGSTKVDTGTWKEKEV